MCIISRRAASRFQYTKSCMYSEVRNLFQGFRKMQYPKRCSYATTVLVLRPSERDQGLLLLPMGLNSMIRQMHRHTQKIMCRAWQPKHQMDKSKNVNIVMSNILLRTLISISSILGSRQKPQTNEILTDGKTFADLCIHECYTPHAFMHVQCVFTRHLLEITDVI